MPQYWAGWVFASGTIRFGNSFTITHSTTGKYQITIQPTVTGRFIATTATSVLNGTIARVTQYVKDGLTLQHRIDIEIRDLTGTLVDSDFNFIAMDRSGT